MAAVGGAGTGGGFWASAEPPIRTAASTATTAAVARVDSAGAADAGAGRVAVAPAAAAVGGAAATPAAPAAAAAKGITLAGFDEVIAAAGGREALVGKPTWWVKDHVVMPQTATIREAFSAKLPAATIGPVTHFISHAYTYQFLKAVDAVRAWEARQPPGSGPFFYYFDLLVVNQHNQPAKVAFEQLRKEFHGGVTAAGNTLLFLEWEADPRETPPALTRAWCVFEIYTTITAGATFDVIFAPEDETKLAAAIETDFDALAHRTCVIDVETCTAREPEDNDNIHRCIREQPGFLTVNQRVIGAMQSWMVSVGQRALAALRSSDTTRGSNVATHGLTIAVARLLQAQGKLEIAEPMLREVVKSCELLLGHDHPDTMASISHLAGLLQLQCRFEDAEPLVLEVLEWTRRVRGDDHPATLISINNLACLRQDQGRKMEAEPLFRNVLKLRREILGDIHPDTISSIRNLAGLLHDLGKRAEAEPLSREVLQKRHAMLGNSDPDTLTSIVDLGHVLQAQLKAADAESLFREALKGCHSVLGAAHPLTRVVINALIAQRLRSGGTA